MADNMTAGKRLIDPAPVISKLADRALYAKGLECSLLGEVIDLLMAAPLITHVEQEWIPVTEGLPEENQYVAVYRPNMVMDYLVTRRVMGEWENFNIGPNGRELITHWTLLPELPEEVKRW